MSQLIEVRPYQREAIENTIDLWRSGRNNLLGVAGTGAGKTLIFNRILARMSVRRALILADTNALVEQNAQRANRHSELFPAGVYTGSPVPSYFRVISATVQSLVLQRNIKHLGQVDIVIYDECHGSVTGTGRTVLHKLRQANPGLLLLGVTATAIREDGWSLGSQFEHLAFHIPVDYLIREGYLVRPVGHVFSVPCAQTGTQTTVLGHPEAPAFIFGKWYRLAGDRRTLCYTGTVAEARELSLYFTRQGIDAAYIHGRQSRALQRSIEQRYRRGEIQIVFNAQIWTQGMDIPETSCVILARRMASQLLFIQCVGRGLRRVRGKEDCLVLGFHPEGMHPLIQQGDVFQPEAPPLPLYRAADFHKDLVPEGQLGFPKPSLAQLAWELAIETVYDLLSGRSDEDRGFRYAWKRIKEFFK